MDRDALKKLSKDELVELVLKLQRPALTSRTSSRPPSTDRKAKRSGSKPGGAKPGHKGHSRAPSKHPDLTVMHRPAECAKCGRAFTDAAQGHVISEHETLDLPSIQPIITRHQRLSCTCGACGHRTKAASLAQGSPFGPNIQALALYLKHFQHVSYQRLERLFSDIFGLKISQGGLSNLLRRSKPALDAEKAAILQQVRQAEAIASDETGVRIEGVNAQHWVFRTQNAVLHETAFSRGAQVVRDVMAGHRPAFWTSDRYGAQPGHGKHHQSCLAHLARDIAYALEASNDLAPFWLKRWIDDVFAFWRRLPGAAASTIAAKRRSFDDRIGKILMAQTTCDLTRKLLAKIARARDQLLTFMVSPPGLVEPTNNACERALRPAVIARKVTNGFRSVWGAEADAAVRSLVDTKALAGVGPYTAIRAVVTA